MPLLMQNLHIITKKAKMKYFDELRAIRHGAIWTIIKLEDMVLSNVTKIHKI